MASPRPLPATPDRPRLIPSPRRIRRQAGRVALTCSSRNLAALRGFDPGAAEVVERALRAAGAGPESGPRGRKAGAAPDLSAVLVPLEFSESPESYRLTLGAGGVRIEAPASAGIYYAARTLASLLHQYGRVLPALVIEDAPRYEVRGFLCDVSRGKVPRRAGLAQLVEHLASLKYNQLQLYVEHTFAFRRHPLPGRGHSPLTAADIRTLGRLCRRHHIELVPCLQSFGHASHFLRHARYAGLAESAFRGGWTLSPAEPGTYRLLKELYADFLPSFPSGQWFNACCDETWDLGRGKTRTRAKREGQGRVYLDHLLRVRELAARHGRRPLFWADILEKHPECVAGLPSDAGLLFWNYEPAASAAALTRRMRRLPTRGREWWVCPGTSSWNALFFRRSIASVNIFQTARAGAAAGARGLLLTDWGDNGHYNFSSASLWPMAYAAQCAWSLPSRPPDELQFDEDFAACVLGDSNPAWVEAGRLLGGLADSFGVAVPNYSPERWLLTGPPPEEEDLLGVARMIEPYRRIGVNGLRRALGRAERAATLLVPLRPVEAELGRVRDEWLLSARLAGFACRLELARRDEAEPGDTPASLRGECRALARRFAQVWMARNKRSDLGRIEKDFRRIEAAIGAKPSKRRGRLQA